jgi:hypothetical protein
MTTQILLHYDRHQEGLHNKTNGRYLLLLLASFEGRPVPELSTWEEEVGDGQNFGYQSSDSSENDKSELRAKPEATLVTCGLCSLDLKSRKILTSHYDRCHVKKGFFLRRHFHAQNADVSKRTTT